MAFMAWNVSGSELTTVQADCVLTQRYTGSFIRADGMRSAGHALQNLLHPLRTQRTFSSNGLFHWNYRGDLVEKLRWRLIEKVNHVIIAH